MSNKIKRLLRFGTKKVVWNLSTSRQILVADNTNRWQLLDWVEPVELMPGVPIEIFALMGNAEISPPPMSV